MSLPPGAGQPNPATPVSGKPSSPTPDLPPPGTVAPLAQPYPPAPGYPPGTAQAPGPAGEGEQVQPGPGVTVPFTAPPTERDAKRLWITLGVAGALVVLCLIGGVLGVAALVAGSRASASDATARVSDYLNALQAKDFSRAYDDLCTAQQDQQSPQEFRRAQTEQPDISSYQLGTPIQRSDGFDVPARIELDDGGQFAATFGLVLEGPGDLRICSIGE